MENDISDIRQFIFFAILKEKNFKPSSYKPTDDWFDSNLIEDFGFDSLETVEVIMDCEEKYKISFSDKDILEIRTPNDIIHKIQCKKRM